MNTEQSLTNYMIRYYERHISQHVLKLLECIDQWFLWIFPILSPFIIYISGVVSYFMDVFIFCCLLSIILIKIWIFFDKTEKKSHKEHVPINVSVTNSLRERLSSSYVLQQRQKQGYREFAEKGQDLARSSGRDLASFCSSKDMDDNSTINDEYNPATNVEPLNAR